MKTLICVILGTGLLVGTFSYLHRRQTSPVAPSEPAVETSVPPRIEAPATTEPIPPTATAPHSSPVSEVTQVLEAIAQGDPHAAEELLPLVYQELRKLAACRMAREKPGQTLQPTALVHEAWLRLAGNKQAQWEGRSHFFSAAAEAMRRILIDNARRKQALRHKAGDQRLDVQEIEIAAPGPDDQMLAMDEALDKLAAADAPKAELVKMRYFAGMSIEETAKALGISEATAKRWWSYARAWLLVEMKKAVS